MNRFILNRLYIENFKLFENKTIEFSGDSLIIFDGPNGFGKTTLFDAIELALTGRIYRIDAISKNLTDNTATINDYLLQKDKNKDIFIKLELIDKRTNEKFTLIKHLNKNNLQGGKAQQWSSFRSYISRDFEVEYEQISRLEKLDQAKLDKIFQESLIDHFKLFYYIQQEEDTFFLKAPERTRAEKLNRLFDLENEDLERDKLVKTRKEVKIRVKNLEDQLKEIKLPFFELQEVKYEQLITFNPIIPEWDREDLVMTTENTRQKYILRLKEIGVFIDNFSDFEKYLDNKRLNKVIENRFFLEAIIVMGNFVNNVEQMIKTYSIQNELIGLSEILIMKNIEELDLTKLKQYFEFNIVEVKEKIDKIVECERSAGELSKIVAELNEVRDEVLKHNNSLQEKLNLTDAHCPLCGYDWKNYMSFIKEIEKKKKLFEIYYDSSIKQKHILVEELYAQHLYSALKNISEALVRTGKIINKEFYKYVNYVNNNKESIQKFISFCKDKNVDIESFFHKSIDNESSVIHSEVTALINTLESKKHILEDNDFESSELLFSEIFNSKKENVDKIDKSKIVTKIKFIDYIYYHSNLRKMESIRTKLVELYSIESRLKELIAIYNREITKHREKVCRDIQIPFYIYSGKLVQDHQRGSGVFIDIHSNRIKFLPSPDTGHDVVSSMSSGQISAIVVSFTLALNKVYSSTEFNTVLIDDPLQTMDDINMVSFVELLRNEFEDKQLVISTHENNVASYIEYKYQKYNARTKSINIKNHR